MNDKYFFLKKSLLAAGALLAFHAADAQYCNTGLYTQTGCTGDHIQSFSTTGGTTNISNLNSGCINNANNYLYYSAMTHTTTHGGTVNFTITNTPSFSEYYKIWVDWNADGDFLDPGEEVYNGGLRGAGSTFSGNFVVPAGASVGQTRLRVRSAFNSLAGACDVNSWGEAEDYNIFITPSTPNTAIPGGIATPSLFCEGTYPVSVKIKNNGNNVINSVVIDWELDGVPMNPINYTTPIPVITATPGSNEATVTLGNVSFVAPTFSHTIMVTVTSPNGGANNAPTGTNTATYTIGAGLDGVYTVGGTAADFPDVVTAVNYLNAFNICGPVTMRINPGVYTGRARLGNVSGSSQANRITFESSTGNAADVTITDVTNNAAASSYVFSLSGASDVTLKNISIATSGTSGSGAALELTKNISRDSVIGCKLSAISNGSWSTFGILGDDMQGNNNVFNGNTIVGGDYGIYFYADIWSGKFFDNVKLNNNSITDAFAQSMSITYVEGLEINDNVINTTGIVGNVMNVGHSGISLSQCGEVDINRNNIRIQNGGYGMQFWALYASSPIMLTNNVIAVGGNANSVGYGILDDNSSDIHYYNNSIHVFSESTGGAAVSFNFTSNHDIKNNIFSNTGGGRAMYMSSATLPGTTCDYNNLHATGATLVAVTGSTSDSLSAWRNMSPYDHNSISYDPGYMGQTNLLPDPSNPASWSLNGRGVHIAGNNLDKTGNTRVTDRKDGVPDIGAYEFTPVVMPPLAKAIPATAAMGSTQTFTFGGDTVAVVHWSPSVPVPGNVAVRQYTGTVPPQFPVSNHMYFYTDIDVINATYDVDADIFYKDPWLGKMPVENTVKIAKKEPQSSKWIAYNDVPNVVDPLLNKLKGNTFTSLGYFTGIENDSLFSAFIKPASTTVFCNGGSVTLEANTDPAYTYQWKRNNTVIPSATSSTYVATIAGIYHVEIMKGNMIAQSQEVNVTIVQSPNTHVSLNGPSRICLNSSVTLSATAAAGQTYQWQYNGVDIQGATGTSYVANSGGNYSVRVKNIGCADISAPIIIVQGPLNVDLGLDTSYCQHAPLVLDAGNSGARYMWSTGDTTQQITVTGLSGQYWVAVNAGANCTASDTIGVLISPAASVIGISYIKSGNTYQFEPSGAQNVDNYLWIFGDGTTDTSRAIKHEYTGGNYNLRLVVFNACGSDTATLTLPLTINEMDNEGLVVLYPNPAKDQIMLSVNGDNTLFNDVVIVNSIGQVVLRETDMKDVKSRKIDITSLADGHYIIKAATNKGSFISKPFQVMR